MAIKAKIDVGVDDAAFGAFAAKFFEFQASLKQTPEAWRQVAAASDVAREAFEKVSASAKKHADAIETAASGVSRLRQTSEATARSWHDMSRSTATVLKNIKGMTESLMAWTGITGILGGIFAGGGFLGFSHFAHTVSAQRTSALAVGSSIGNQRAADIAYSRFLGGPGSGAGFGSRIADLQRTSEGRAALARLLPGMSPDEIANADPYDLEGQLIQAGHRLARGTSVAQLRNTPALTGVFSGSQINILHGSQVQESEYAAAPGVYARNKAGLSLQNPRAWQDFEQTLAVSEAKIKTTFIDRLTKLDGPLSELINKFTDVADRVINSAAFDDVLKKLNAGAEWLAKEVDKPEFRQGVDSLIASLARIGPILGQMAHDLVSFAKWMGFEISPVSSAKADYEPPGKMTADQFENWVRDSRGAPAAGSHAEEGAGSAHYASGPAHASGAIGAGKRKTMSAYARGLKAGGFSDEAIAAAMGAVTNEDPSWNSSNRHPDQPRFAGEAHFAHGLNQIGGAEWNKYAAWLRAHGGGDWRDPQLQGEFVAWDIKTNHPDLYQRLRRESAGAGGADFEKHFERPARWALPGAMAKARAGATRSATLVSHLLNGDPHDEADASPHTKPVKPRTPASSLPIFAASPVALTVSGVAGSNTIISASTSGSLSGAQQ